MSVDKGTKLALAAAIALFSTGTFTHDIENAFSDISLHMSPRIEAYAKSLARDHKNDVEDIVQISFQVVWNKRLDFRHDDLTGQELERRFEKWVFGIVRFVDLQTRAINKLSIPGGEFFESRVAPIHGLPHDDQEEVHEVLGKMRPENADLLRWIYGFAYDRPSSLPQEIRDNTLHQRLSRARAEFKDLLRKNRE